MAIGRDDRWVADGLGRALSGAQVFWCTQPATVGATPPPSPLATIYTDITGTVPETQPIFTDGFGHAYTYLTEGVLFTVAIYHPLFGEFPIVLPDQTIGGGGGGSTVTAFAGIPSGTIDGVNTVFTVVNGATPLTAIPTQITAWLNFPLIQNIGYTLSIVGGQLKITYANPPQPAVGSTPADNLFAQGVFIS
jgi:hypothetical protein